MRLIGIHANTLGIPETEYKVGVTTASNEFTHIVRHNLSQPDDSFRIEVNKEGICDNNFCVNCGAGYCLLP